MLHLLRYLVVFVAAASASAQSSKPVFDPLNPPADTVAKPPPKPAATLAPKVAPVLAAPAAKTTVPAAATAPATAVPAPKPSGPQTVSFDELEQHVGKQISITTNLRTTRKGTLKRFNRAGIVIEDSSRGAAMNIDIPRSTVVSVQVLN